MSKLAQIQRRLGMMNEIKDIMGAMRNISLMETHKLARFLAHQHRVLASIEAIASDFLSHHPEIAYPAANAAPGIIVAVGSQRGFCGDFNESLVDVINHYRQQSASRPPSLVIVGRRLASRLSKDVRVASSFDGPTVADEVQPVLRLLMNALSELQEHAGQAQMLGVTVIAHYEGEEHVATRSILPAPQPARLPSRFAYPPLLDLPAPAFFSQLARHYVWAHMHDVFYTSLMAENRRRLQHMEGAMQRMEERAGEMQRKCNMLRQEEITEEIEVIMLSNEALQTSRQNAAKA